MPPIEINKGSEEINLESIVLPCVSILTGFIFLLAYEYFLPKSFFIAMATITLILGCTFLAVHPLIGNDTKQRKVVEALLSIFATLITFGIASYYKIKVWDADLVSDIAATLCFLSIVSLVISLAKTETQKSTK